VVRGPREDQESGRKVARWYWRARRYEGSDEATVWTGWATREEAEAEGLRIGHTGKASAGGERCDTVTDLLDFFLAGYEDRADIRDRSKATTRAVVLALRDTIGGVRLERVSLRTLEDHRDQRMRGGGRGKGARKGAAIAPWTVERELRVFGVAWRWGFEQGLHELAPIPRPKLKVRAIREARAPTPLEIAAVVRKLPAWPALLTHLLFALGSRLGEATALTVADLDLDATALVNGRATPCPVVNVDGKTGPREVPLTPPIARKLREWVVGKAPGDRLLPVTKSSADTSLRRYLKAACEAAGVRYFTAKGLRRHATNALYKVVDPGSAAGVQGHSPEVALRNYRRAHRGDLAQAVKLARLGYLPEEQGAQVVNFPGATATEEDPS
jgi:integrase